MKRKICVVSGSRAEYGLLRPLLKGLAADKGFETQVVVTGMHLSSEFGHTADDIKKDKFKVTEYLETQLSSDTKVGMGKSLGLGVLGFVDCFKRIKPDIVLVVGDRYEVFSAVVAATTLNLAVAHFSGGDVTEGSIDNQIRHAITKMSHIHFATIEESARRIRQMGEEPWRVKVIGQLSLDYLRHMRRIDEKQLEKVLGVDLSNRPAVLATFHPVTLRPEQTRTQIENLLEVLGELKTASIFITYPNADADSHLIISAVKKFTDSRPNAKAFKSLGSELYLNLLSHVDLCIGNSSSGIVESPSLKVPTVNIGDRQTGRVMSANVICSSGEKSALRGAVKKALSPSFKRSLENMRNPYDKGDPTKKIMKVLKTVGLDQKLLVKKFADLRFEDGEKIKGAESK